MKNITPLLVCLMLAGCSTQPAYQRPQTPMTESWKNATLTASDIDPNWWVVFNSVELNNLIKEAKANNTDLRAGLQRIEQARAQVKIASSALLPNVGTSADLTLSGGKDQAYRNALGAGATTSYEIDLFRRNRNTANAAQHRLTATLFDQETLDLLVTGDTAQRYFEIAALLEQKRLTQETITVFQDTMKIIDARFTEGAASGLEVSQQKVALSNAEASLASIDQQISVAENALAILLGKPPQQSVNAVSIQLNQLTIPDVAPLQPAMLLERRPDIRSFEEELKAANADIAVARAALYPSLTIGGGVSMLASPIASTPGLAANALSSLAATIFSGGRLTGQVELANARQKELIEAYRSAILVAFRETEDALATVSAAHTRENKFSTSVTEAHNAYDIAHERYISGATDFLELLDAQRSLLQAQQSYVQAKLDRLAASLSLFKALGGGWRS